VQEKITFGNGYSSQTCSDPDAANKLAPYCKQREKKKKIIKRL
jgi:hypothetical protein